MSQDLILSRLQALEDIRAIEQVVYGYAYHIDSGEADAWMDLFTDPWILDIQMLRPDGGRDDHASIRGYDALKAHITNFKFTNAQSNVISQPVVQLDGDRASSVAYAMVIRERDGGPQIFSYGRYYDDLTRCADGKWRIARRVLVMGTFSRSTRPRLKQ